MKKKINIEINFSNYLKKRKRNLEIIGTNGSLFYRGYDKKKIFFKKNKKKNYLDTVDIDPLKNLLKNFRNKVLVIPNSLSKKDCEISYQIYNYVFPLDNIQVYQILEMNNISIDTCIEKTNFG